MQRRLLILALIFLLSGSAAFAQILESNPEKMGDPIDRPEHIGLCLGGTSGLVTIPTPDFRKNSRVGISYKGGIFKQDLVLGGKLYKAEKNEHFTAITYNIKPNLEFSVNHLDYERCCDPVIGDLNYSEDMTSFGLKYSAKNGNQDFCFGGYFAPMNSEELNKADLGQIDNLRAIYMTVSEEVAEDFYGYLHLKTSFTAEQKINLGNNQIIKLDKKEFIISGIGIEYKAQDRFSLFCESQFANYRDLYLKDATQMSINAGIRVGGKGISLEAMGLSLNKDPRVILGGNLAF